MSVSNYTGNFMDGKTVWSDDVQYFFYPSNMTFTSGTITVEAADHGLATDDIIDIEDETETSSLWTTTMKNITVVDRDTFTYDQVSSPGDFPDSPYGVDTMPPVRGPIKITCQAYSLLMFNPTALQVEALDGNTEVKIQAKLVERAPFIDVQTLTSADGDTLVSFAQKYNIVRVMLSVSGDQPIVHAQPSRPGS